MRPMTEKAQAPECNMQAVGLQARLLHLLYRSLVTEISNIVRAVPVAKHETKRRRLLEEERTSMK